MRIGIVVLILSCFVFSCGSDKKGKKGVDKSGESENQVSMDNSIKSKKDTVIFVNIESEDYEDLVNQVADLTGSYFGAKDTTKMYNIKGDSLLIHKSQLTRLTKLYADDPSEAFYLLNDDTLKLENDCSGTELINVRDTLKVIYQYYFDCVESSSYSELRYYVGLDNCLIYHDDFSEEWIPQYIEESKIRSKRRASFLFPNTNRGYRIETIQTTTDLDTIKIYRINSIEKIDKKLIKKMLPTETVCGA